MIDRALAIEAWLAGESTAADRARLAEACRQDPDLATQIAEQAGISAVIEDVPVDARALAKRIGMVIRQDRASRKLRTITGIRQRLASAPRHWSRSLALAAMLLLAVSGSLIWFVLAPDNTPRLKTAATCTIHRGERTVPPRPELRLQPGDRITTRAGETVLIQWPDVDLALEPGSTLTIDETPLLSTGSALVRVVPGQPFAVHTPHTTATVAGTAFRVSVTEIHSRMAVEAGRVRFGDATVAAGQKARMDHGAPRAHIVERPELVAHWRFDDPQHLGRDDSGQGRDLHLVGPQSAAGVSGGALRFDGNDDYAWTTDTQDLDFNDGFGISFFIKNLGNLHCWPISAKHGSWENADGFAIECNVNWLSFLARGRENIRVDPYRWDREWHHIAVSYAADGAELYVDGQRMPLATPPRRLPPTTPIGRSVELFTLGRIEGQRFDDGDQPHFHGLLDDIRLYDRPLTPGDIAALADRTENQP